MRKEHPEFCRFGTGMMKV